MKAFSVRVDDELHIIATAKADDLGISLADLVRGAVHTFCTQNEKGLFEPSDMVQAQLHTRDTQIEHLLRELSEVRQSCDEARTRSDSIIMQLSKTIESQQMQITDKTLMIEDLRQPKSFWNRLFNGKKRQAKVTT